MVHSLVPRTCKWVLFGVIKTVWVAKHAGYVVKMLGARIAKSLHHCV